MEFIEKAKKIIKEDWFENHIAEMKGEEGLQVISWGEPGTSMYRTKYVLSGNNVFISGDIGEAVYTLTCKATLENIKDFNLGYFTKKLSAYSSDRWDFDADLAKKELDEYWKEYELNENEENQEIYDGILSAIEESTSLESYRAWLMPVYQNTSVETDILEGVWDFGKRMPYSLIAYWLGLQLIIQQIEEKEQAIAK